jgi:hypothetical protein
VFASNRKAKEIPCYDTDLEKQIGQFFFELFGEAVKISPTEALNSIWDFAYGMVTLESGVTETISICFMLMFLWNIIKGAIKGATSTGPLQAVISILSSFLVGPIPTVFNFFATPFVRWYFFLTVDVPKAIKKSKKVVFSVSGPGEMASSDGVHNASSPKREPQFVQFNSEQGAAIYQIRNICAKCGLPDAAKTCSKCHAVQYCGETCQKNDWKSNHKTQCKNLQDRAKEITGNLQSPEAQEQGAPTGEAAVMEGRKYVLAETERHLEIIRWREEILEASKDGPPGTYSAEEWPAHVHATAVARSQQELHEQASLAADAAVASGQAIRNTQIIIAPFPGKEGTPGGLHHVIGRRTVQQGKMRNVAASLVKFEFLLTLTKPVVPLAMLVATGTVYNGLIPSMIIGHTIREWVPAFTCETLYCVVFFFGVVHTYIGVSEGQIAFAAEQNSAFIPLAWEYSFRDVVSVANLAMLGASFSAHAANANEPGFVTAFASGLAVRTQLAEVVPAVLAGSFTRGLAQMKLVLANAEEVVTRCGGGIGDCAGGPFRMLFGAQKENLSAVQFGIQAAQAYLLLLPLLHTSQWALRAYIAWGKWRRGKEGAGQTVVQCAALSVGGATLCYTLATLPFNGVNGSLIHYLVLVIVGILWESLLATYEVVEVTYFAEGAVTKEGTFVQVFFFLIFVLI